MTTSNTVEPAVTTPPDPRPAEDFGTSLGEVLSQETETPPAQALAVAEEPRFLESSSTTGRRCNVGRTEQKFRLAMGAGLITAAAFAPLSRGWRIALGVAGAAELITGSLRYCPVSQLFGINTCRGDEQ